MKTRTLWIGFAGVLVVSFTVLLIFGREIYRQRPPVPKQVVSASGKVLMTEQQIRDGQNAWQSTGGQELGTVWGHGSYQAPDWTADYLHREAVFILDAWAKESGAASYRQLPDEQKAALDERLKKEIRTNTYDPSSGTRYHLFEQLAAGKADRKRTCTVADFLDRLQRNHPAGRDRPHGHGPHQHPSGRTGPNHRIGKTRDVVRPIG
jgi:nitric oxide reductase large subunit